MAKRQFSLTNFLMGQRTDPKDLIGTSVWAPDDDLCYTEATVTEVGENGEVVVQTAAGKTISGKKFSNRDVRDEKEADLVQMGNVDTPNILHTLRHRHKEGSVYTAVGVQGILISINPYKWMDIYGTGRMREYYEAFGDAELAPHVFALAADAYRSLCRHGTSQCLVTSGESGSGKTENSKQVFRFLAEIAGRQSSGDADGGVAPELRRDLSGSSPSVIPGLSASAAASAAAGGTLAVSMQELLIHSNPLLEAFGNAKTLRNDNSSRFGKLVTVHFDGSGRIAGAFTRNYLLERTRVSSAPSGERNYHAFYQLLGGGTEKEKTSRFLPGTGGAAAHAMLRGGVLSAGGIDDAAEWRITCNAMAELGFSADEQSALLDVLAAL